ncbi:MAG TPA: DUF1573 domain-containing protein, partial [Planctomycetota bacterium]
PAQVASASTPAAQPAALAPSDPAPVAAAASEPAPQPDMSKARGGGKRARGTEADKLDTGFDLSKVQPVNQDTHDGHVHGPDDGHDHAAEVAQDGSSLLPAAQAQRMTGRIELVDGSQQVQELGKLRQGESAAHEFRFQSKGEGPLIISGVKPSCGCTKAEIVLVAEDGTRSPYTKGDAIPVGQKFVLESEISTDGKPGGPFSAQISIYGNDGRGVFNVRMTAEIEPILTVTPNSSVFFGRMTTADQKDQSVTVTSTRGEPFVLSVGQETVQGPVKLDLEAKDPDAEGRASEWTVKVTVGPSAEVGLRSYPINLRTDIPIANPKYPSKDGAPQMHAFMLNVQAQVTGMVSAEPSFLTFGMVKPSEPIERSLRLECHDDFKLTADIPVVIEGLQGQAFPFQDAFAVTVEPLEEGRVANVKVRLNGLPADLNGSFGGILRLQLGHPHMAEIQVRFSGVCRPPLPTAGAPQPITLPAPGAEGPK